MPDLLLFGHVRLGVHIGVHPSSLNEGFHLRFVRQVVSLEYRDCLMTGCGHDLEMIMVGLPPVIDAGVTKVMEGEVSDACLLASVLVSRPDVVFVDRLPVAMEEPVRVQGWNF